jgi:hypothetical protein
MLNALIKAENDLNHIRDIVHVEQRGGEQFHLSQGHAHASVAEKTIQRYGGSEAGKRPSSGTFTPDCFGCGDPHPYSRLIDGKYVVVCPRADEPGIKEKAEMNIQRMQARKKRNARNNKKRKNLNTVNWEDIPASRRAVLSIQHQESLAKAVPSGASSTASSITAASSPGLIRRSNITLHQDVVVMSTQSSKPQIPIAIHSPMPHLTLQTGASNEEKDCPGLRCMIDTGASLSTANFHYMEAVVRQYPQILKAIYLPEDYAAIVLSGIVTSSAATPITTELSVGFEIHLPYVTKDGNETSLLVAAGPDVAVNLILGLPFIKATGMIVDFINNVCDAKHLVCDPFPIDFCRATKSIPAVGVQDATPHSVEIQEVLRALASIKALISAQASGATLRSYPAAGTPRAITPSIGAPARNVMFDINNRWVSPSKSAGDTNDYVHHVLGDMGYL